MTLITYLTRVHFADGVLEDALWSEMEAAPKKRPLILSDLDQLDSEIGERLLAGLPARTRGEVYSDIPHIPTESDARKVAEAYKAGDCDVLLAFGGGRAIDLAKIARIAIVHDEELSLFSHKNGGSRLIGESLPDLFAVPGISGFGTAVSAHAPVIIKPAERALIMCKKLIPNVTICDPTLTLGVSAPESASAGADAITQCVEAYLSKSYNPPAEGIALDGLGRAITNLPIVLKDDNDIHARREMMAAGLNGSLALQKGLGASRAISNALDAVCSKPLDQGALNRITLPSVLRFNDAAVRHKRSALQRLFDMQAGDSLADGIDRYFDRLPLPTSLSQLGLDLEHLRAAAMVASDDLATDTNPRSIGASDYLSIMRSVH